MTSRSRVFVVQEPLKKDHDGSVVPRFTMDGLARYGDVIMVLAWADMRPPINELFIMRKIGECFQQHGGLRPDDYIVPTGHPAAIAMVTMAAYDASPGPVRMLCWDAKFRKYDVITLDLENLNR